MSSICDPITRDERIDIFLVGGLVHTVGWEIFKLSPEVKVWLQPLYSNFEARVNKKIADGDLRGLNLIFQDLNLLWHEWLPAVLEYEREIRRVLTRPL